MTQHARHDWFIAAWSKSLGKRQVDFVNDLGWNKARVSLMFCGKQAYDREAVNEVAAYLQIAPHELLQHPADAMAIRQLRAAVHGLSVRDSETNADDEPERLVSSG